MAFIRVRTINGKQYTYEEHRWRGVDGKVKSRSIYLGGGVRGGSSSSGGSSGGSKRRRLQFLPQPIAPEDRGMKYIERWMERDAKKEAAKAAELDAAKDRLSKELGVDLSPNAGPVEKTAPEQSAQSSNAGGAAKDGGGEAEGDK